MAIKSRLLNDYKMRLSVLLVLCSSVQALHQAPTLGEIYRWTTRNVIPGTVGIAPRPQLQLPNHDLVFADLDGQNLAGANFENSDLQRAWLRRSHLDGANLANINLTAALVWSASMADSNLIGANLSLADLNDVDLLRADLTGANLEGSRAWGADLSNADLTSANLHAANFEKAEFRDTVLTDATITNASFRFAKNLTHAQLASTASFRDHELKGIVLHVGSGWDFSNQDLTEAILLATPRNADFAGAWVKGAHLGDFTESQLMSTASYQQKNLVGVRLERNDLSNWDFRGQNLTGARFYGANMSGTDLSDAWIEGVDFENTALTKSQLASTSSYQAKNLRGIRIRGDFSEWDFRGQDLSHANFERADLSDSDFRDAIITGAAMFRRSGFTEAQFVSTASYKKKDLTGIRAYEANLSGWDFSGQNLTGAQFTQSWLHDADFTDAVITGASFAGASGFTNEQLASTANYKNRNLTGIEIGGDLSGWDFSNQNLMGASVVAKLTGANFSGAIISGANFRNAAEFTEPQLLSTASYGSRDLRKIILNRLDVSGWNFRNQNMTGARLRASVLVNAKFGDADLTSADLHLATLDGADLTGANLTDANLGSASLQNADATNANFALAVLLNADLSHASLQGAVLNTANLGTAELENTVFDSNTVYNQWTIFPEGFDPVSAGLTYAASSAGDVDGNGILDAVDIDVLQQAVRNPLAGLFFPSNGMFDLNQDSIVDNLDVTSWVREIKKTWYGDANLDSQFDSTDLVAVFQLAQYEDEVSGNSTWATGDWNSDGDFTSSDFVLAFQDGGFEKGPRELVGAVPEPGGIGSVVLAALWCVLFHRKAHRH